MPEKRVGFFFKRSVKRETGRFTYALTVFVKNKERAYSTGGAGLEKASRGVAPESRGSRLSVGRGRCMHSHTNVNISYTYLNARRPVKQKFKLDLKALP